jgi:outer membrane protein assembly factor BamB
VSSRSLFLLTLSFLSFAESWPEFRGPLGNGHSKETNLPLTWSESKGVKWKVELPGSGWSTPVVVDNEIWLTTSTDGAKSLRVLTVDAMTGKLRQNVEVFRLSSAVQGHEKNSGASPSAIVEGDRVYVHFGSYGTACLRRNGEIVWRNQELKYAQVHGPGGSPVLYENLLILNADGHDTQFVVALDKNTGKVVWRKPRNGAMAYSTPLVIQTQAGPQVVSTGGKRAVSYDPRNGGELWSVGYGDGFSNVPRPVFGHGLVYLCTGFYQPQLLAIRPDGKGDITSSHVVWKYTRGVPLTPSPILVGDSIYMVSDNGIVTCLDAKTGKEFWRQRLGESYSASPIYAEGRLYFTSESGETTVLAHDKQFRKLAANQLDGRFLASIAASSGAFYLRSDKHLYRIEKQ